MAKLTLTDIASGYQSFSTYNANNTLIEAALENTLSRDGTTPNTMSANLDMNSNKVVNVANGTNAQDACTVAQLDAATLAVGTGGIVNVVEDLTPQLGGDLDLNSQDITGTGNITTTNGYVSASSTGGSRYFEMVDTDAAADEKKWWIGNASGNLSIFASDDAEVGGTVAFNVSRTGTAIDDWYFNAPQKRVNYVSQDTNILSGTMTVPYTTANYVEQELFENVTTMTVTGAPASGIYGCLRIKLTQDGTGGWTWVPPSGTVWNHAGGCRPKYPTAANSVVILKLETWDGGTTWYATQTPEVVTGSFTGTLQGCTTAPTETFYYTITPANATSYRVDLWFDPATTFQATSNTTGLSVTGLPTAITPTNNDAIGRCLAVDNGSPASHFDFTITTGGGFVFYKDGSTTGFTNTGTKGLSFGGIWQVSYICEL